MDKPKVATLGTIISHGYLTCGFLPIRVAFPVLAATLLGPGVVIHDSIITEAFADYLCVHESGVLRQALAYVKALVALLSRYDCTTFHNMDNLYTLVVDVARHVFLGKPFGLLYTMSSEVPSSQQSFWVQFSVEKLFELYKALNATPTTVLGLIEEPEFETKAESNVFYYLTSFIGNCKQEELRSFLRFVTGSSVVIDNPITITFNTLSGIAKRPIRHTCDCVLELPATYSTFMEFEQDFNSILAQEDAWTMDAV